MIEKTLAIVGILGLAFFCSLIDYNPAKLIDFEAELKQTKQEKMAIEIKMHEFTRERDQLQRKIEGQTKSRNALVDDLAETTVEKDAIEARMHELTQERDRLQKEIMALTDSCDQLKATLAEHKKLHTQINELAISRAQLQKKNDELTKSCDAAMAEVETAKHRVDELAKKLEAETEKVRLLQDQLLQIQAELAMRR